MLNYRFFDVPRFLVMGCKCGVVFLNQNDFEREKELSTPERPETIPLARVVNMSHIFKHVDKKFNGHLRVVLSSGMDPSLAKFSLVFCILSRIRGMDYFSPFTVMNLTDETTHTHMWL